MKDIKYWVIVGREKCSDGKWRWTHNLKYTLGDEYCIRKILSKQVAQEWMRELKKLYSQERLETKLGKVRNSDINSLFLNGLGFDEGDYIMNDEYSECIQVKRLGKPIAIFYCVPMYHVPNIIGRMY